MLGGDDQAMTQSPAILLCGSDGTDAVQVAALNALASELSSHPATGTVFAASIGGTPAIADGLATLAADGAKRIICLPVTPFLADAMKTAFPVEIRTFTDKHPDINVILGRDPGIDPRMLRAAEARLKAALPTLEKDAINAVLMVVGPGAFEPEANAGIAKMTRMIWEGVGFAWAEVSYADTAFPSVAKGLETATRLGYRHIVILPYLLSAGAQLEKINTAVSSARSQHPNLQFTQAAPLGAHPEVIAVLIERIAEALEGGNANAMNCQLCTYREQVLGQESPTHEHSHDHDHHGHAHDHSHD